MAVLFGVRTVIQKKWRQVIIEIDCLLVHHYLIRRSCDLVFFGAILDTCFVLPLLRSSFISLSFSFVTVG